MQKKKTLIKLIMVDNMKDIQTIFDEIEKELLNSNKPSDFIQKLSEKAYFNQKPFDMILNLKNIEQSPIHHKEGNVFNHLLLSIDEASLVRNKSKNQKVFMWATFLHDLGKLTTTRRRRGKITSYDHDKAGYDLTKEFLSYFDVTDEFIESVARLVRWHMQVLFISRDMPFADLENMKKQVDINEIALVGLCDRLGRKDVNSNEVKDSINKFIEKAYA